MDKFFEVSPISGIWCSGSWCSIYKRILCTFIFYLFFAACNHKTLNGIVITSCPIENSIILFAIPYMQYFINMIKKIFWNRKFFIFSIQRRIQNSFFDRTIIYEFRILFIVITQIEFDICIVFIVIFRNISITTIFNMVIIINKQSNTYQRCKNQKNYSYND
ncbi:hypothetical protein BACCAP_03021 [Pseudoflavonifractor capillosus ATCC 29799]|uniref:Uncharacterized protein n=1 Tax=Pseudoflavonifractor capillosus ATCC 29799 TaxID=411467 RepID=A6NXS6_9FIRM|nr:hypothetical protein BACCAP_03021 [Pseudoflavonifractor capillosus ATCC 29799]